MCPLCVLRLTLLDFLTPLLPNDKPTHLLGIADPESAEAVAPLLLHASSQWFTPPPS